MAGVTNLGWEVPALPWPSKSLPLVARGRACLTEAPLCFGQGQLLSISAAYGDLEMVQYLLTEKHVELSTEPTDDNPAVVAAHFGHAEVVQELLESLTGKAQHSKNRLGLQPRFLLLHDFSNKSRKSGAPT